MIPKIQIGGQLGHDLGGPAIQGGSRLHSGRGQGMSDRQGQGPPS